MGLIHAMRSNGLLHQVPILLGKGHVRIVVKKLSRLHEDILDEMKAIVKYILLCGIETTLSGESVMEVITQFDLVEMPKSARFSGTTMKENDGKKTMKLMSGLHVSSLFKTFLPLPIILQKTTGKTGSFEGVMQDTVKPPKIIPRFSPFDIDQWQSEIKVLSCRWVDKVHPPNDIASTLWLPLFYLFFPNKVLGESQDK